MTAVKNFRVDSFVAGLAIKAPVKVASSGPLTLVGEQTVNSRALLVGDRVLVKDQVDPIENGIYVVETSAWQRAGDFDGSRDVVGGTVVPAYRVSDQEFVYWIVGGSGQSLTPDVDAMNFSVFFDPAGGAVEIDTLQDVTTRGNTTDQGIVVSAVGLDVTGGGIDVSDGNIELSGSGDIRALTNRSVEADYTDANGFIRMGPGTGNNRRITVEGGILEIIADGGLASVSIFGGSNLSIIQGGVFYMEQVSAADANLSNLGQFWVRDDEPMLPIFRDDSFAGGSFSDQVIDPSLSEINIQNGNYTTVRSDKGKTIQKNDATASITCTIDAEASTPLPLGTLMAFDNSGSADWDIDVGGADTLIFADDGTTGTRTLAPDGYAVAQKVAAGTWKIAGKQLS